MSHLTPDDFATEQQIAKNHKRVAELTCPPLVDDLFADELRFDFQQAALKRQAQELKRARGEDLPLFAT